MDLKNLKNLLKKYQIFPSKGLGQNFLVDLPALKRIAEVAKISKEDTILEIGPGTGNLTLELAKKARKIIAVEKDQRMIQVLKEILRDFSNVEIIQGDILKTESLELIAKNYKLVANLPYYITSPVIRKFLETEKPPSEMILTIQEEVGQRICAKPPKMSLLAVSVQFYAQPEILAFFSKKSFWPQPKVDSVLIKITPKERKEILKPLKKAGQINFEEFRNLFFKVAKAGFSQPRKMLINNLTAKLGVEKIKVEEWFLENKIQPKARAENLSVEDWLDLTKSYIIYK